MKRLLRMGMAVSIIAMEVFSSPMIASAGSIGVAGNATYRTVIDSVEAEETFKDIIDGGEFYFIGSMQVEKSDSGYYNESYVPCEENMAAWKVTGSTYVDELINEEREKVGQTDTLVAIRYVMEPDDGIEIGDESSTSTDIPKNVIKENHYERVEYFNITKHWKRNYMLSVTETGRETVAGQEQQIQAMDSDDDPADSAFGLLCAYEAKSEKDAITLTWNAIPNASGYMIYGNQCGKSNPYQKIADVANGSTSWKHTMLQEGASYKYLVVAYKNVNGRNIVITKSKTIHAVTRKAKTGNFKSVKVNKKSITLKVGKKCTLKGKGVKEKGVSKVKEHRKMAYESDDPSVATVTSKGVVKAVGSGVCNIYVFASNGVYKKVRVTVK